MDSAQSLPTLVTLAKQLERADSEMIAIRYTKPLYVADLKTLVAKISHQLSYSSAHYWALSMQDSFHFVAGFLALLYAGKHPVLIDPLQHEMTDVYQAILTDNHNIEQQCTKYDVLNINRLPTNDLVEIPSDFVNETFTLFTSGSTGLPKPIEKTITQLDKEAQLLSELFALSSTSLFVASVSHEHLYGLTFKIILALTNQSIFVCESVQYQEQLQNYNNRKIVYITTPSIIKTADNLLPQIKCKYVISAGGPLNYDDAKSCQLCFGVLPNEIYGSSETGIIATRKQLICNMPWQLFPDMEIKDIDSQAVLYSPLIAIPEPLSDKIEFINQQKFYLRERADKIIKIAENRISLTHIENRLGELAEVDKVIIIPLELKTRTILAAVIRLSIFGTQRLEQLDHFSLSQYFRQQLKITIPLVAVPKRWRFIDDFPVNSQGKSTYIELKSLFNN